ncbi:MAG TPA: alpha/beta fold hydrolase [Bacteroidia bacterium]|jgi:pimeloyl-ACP methyl ester carboxylesterase|nr:alpha/beta fold hydrolase [Bacteroidia bacterium]
MYQKGTDIQIKVNDITLNYDDLGEGKLPIIFIHGFPFDKSSWKLQQNYLSQYTRVITYDIRGFGKSTPGEEKISISLLADDLIKFMDALQVPKAVICGLSMGGYILLNALNRYPDRFAAIILSDTQCIADSAEAKEKRQKNIQLVASGGLSEYTENMIQNLFYSESFTTKPEAIAAIRKVMLTTQPTIITDTLHALANREEMCYTLEKIIIPTLVISGKEDKSIPFQQSSFMHQQIPRSILQLIDKAGHLPNLEQPDEFNRLIKDFALSMQIMHVVD